MTSAARDAELFEHAPPRWIQSRLGLIKPGAPSTGLRALVVVLVGWAPLVILAAIQSLTLRAGDFSSLLQEIEVHTRYLAALLLVLAEASCAARLNATVRHFVDAGLVHDHECGRVEAAVASTRRLLTSPTVEIIVVALSYLVVAAAAYSLAPDDFSAWHKSAGPWPVHSPAGWWNLLVSLPLLLVLIFGWMWRLALWGRLLWLISRLDLRLVASHPDHAAGLGFLGQSVRAFSVVAMAVATIAAGRSASIVLHGGTLPTPHLYFNIGLLVGVLALFTMPLAAFTPTLMRAWRRGALEYGALAERVGAEFERKWLGRSRILDQTALDKPDFSATTDLYQVVSNVYAIRFVPVDRKDLIALGWAMLLPFVPVLLLAVPLDVIRSGIKGLLF